MALTEEGCLAGYTTQFRCYIGKGHQDRGGFRLQTRDGGAVSEDTGWGECWGGKMGESMNRTEVKHTKM